MEAGGGNRPFHFSRYLQGFSMTAKPDNQTITNRDISGFSKTRLKIQTLCFPAVF
jgi:hypothetical protein